MNALRWDRDMLAAAIDDGRIEEVVVALPDLQGRLQGSRLQARYALDEVLAANGLGACAYLLSVDLDMATADGYVLDAQQRGFGDLILRPDLDTIVVPPWWERTALVIADLQETNGRPVEIAPRQILQRQLDKLTEHGLTAAVATELEVIAFRESYQEAYECAYVGIRPLTRHNADYSLVATTELEPLMRRIRRDMAEVGMQFESARGECHPGQYEIVFRYGDPLRICDDHAVYKMGSKVIAGQEGIALTFMAKVDQDEGSSCHVHFSLHNYDAKPSFAGEGRTMPQILRYALAGQLAAMPDFTLLWAPNVNSYKRLQPGAFAPHAVTWGWDDRTCALRVVGDGASRRIEHRVSGADANPYLVVAGIVAASLHGIRERLDLITPKDTAEARPSASLPRDLSEALQCWKSSALARAAFGSEVVAHLARAAEVELDASRRAVSDWERLRGFERS